MTHSSEVFPLGPQEINVTNVRAGVIVALVGWYVIVPQTRPRSRR